MTLKDTLESALIGQATKADVIAACDEELNLPTPPGVRRYQQNQNERIKAMNEKMTMQRFTLYREGFKPIVIRKVTLVDGSYFYEILSYSHPYYIHERWEKIKLSNEQIESQIEKYSDGAVS